MNDMLLYEGIAYIFGPQGVPKMAARSWSVLFDWSALRLRGFNLCVMANRQVLSISAYGVQNSHSVASLNRRVCFSANFFKYIKSENKDECD